LKIQFFLPDGSVVFRTLIATLRCADAIKIQRCAIKNSSPGGSEFCLLVRA
jgi:hypothetical protein